jgi:hypothetical protein
MLQTDFENLFKGISRKLIVKGKPESTKRIKSDQNWLKTTV